VEIYVTILTGFGLGHLLHYGRELNAMDQVIGIMLVIVLVGLLADKTLFSPSERFLMGYRREAQHSRAAVRPGSNEGVSQHQPLL
jgi:ABC-type nitrate/sulfonate/bicarbonate transport system permease component